MSRRAPHLRVALLAALAVAALLAPRAASAQGAAPDSALGHFLGGLADSTDRYFGLSATPLDTAGLDTALVSRLAHPLAPRRRLPVALWPDIAFDRVDGTTWGAGLGVGGPRALGRLVGRIGWTTGSRTRLGGGSYTVARPLADHVLRLRVGGGRGTEAMDRDDPYPPLASLRALAFGTDTRRLLRRDGWWTALDHRRDTWHATVGFRDQLERPLEVTTRWNLSRSVLVVPDNLAATRGRARELRLAGGLRLPRTPFQLEGEYLTSGARLASDFDYRRIYASLSADVGVTRWLSVVPQAVYGRLRGAALPQASFYLGGAGSLRSLDGSQRGGTGMALGRLDVLTTVDMLAAAHVPHPAALPLQLGAFAATGATWGVDPYGGPPRPGTDWPDATAWLPELGVSLFYQPGLPSPTDMVRVDYAWPVGLRHGGPRIALSYTRTLDLLRDTNR